MPLFQVSGWNVSGSPPPAPSDSSNKKRKRRSSDESSQSQLLNTAQINFDKLVQKLGGGGGSSSSNGSVQRGAAAKGDVSGKRKMSKKEAKTAKKVEEKKNAISRPMKLGSKGHIDASSTPIDSNSNKVKESRKRDSTRSKTSEKPRDLERTKSNGTISERPAKRTKRGGTHGDDDELKDGLVAPKQEAKKQTEETSGLTQMQKYMKSSLDGAKFRLINETLYKSDSRASYELMQSDPQVFYDYHTGFRHQVTSWPSNPVSHYIKTLSSYPPKTLVADLGCGEAQLAKSLIPKGLNVLSYDLLGNEYVTEADICKHIPLPGSIDGSEISGIVDVVVCALALMSTNWVGCIREAWRILRDGGELKIAEVSSRFTDMKAFIDIIKTAGFKLASKDESNTHFTMFEFVKVKRQKNKTEQDWEELMKKGGTLKACEYKRR